MAGSRWSSELGPVVAGCERLEVVAGRVEEVHAAPAMVRVDFPRMSLLGVGPMIPAPLAQQLNDSVKGLIVHKKREVLPREINPRLGEVDDATIAQADLLEEPRLNRRRKAKDLGEELRGFPCISCREDRVVKNERR